MTRKTSSLIAVLLTLILRAPLAPAMTIDCGPTLCFQYDETQAGAGILGVPVRVGDSMQFLPPALSAQSLNGAGLASASATFIFDRVFAVSGGNVQSLLAQTEGDYELGGGGSVLARLDMAVSSNLGPGLITGMDVFGTSSAAGTPAIFNLDAAVMPAAYFQGTAGDLHLTISLLLEATTTSPGQLAWVQQKFILTAGDVSEVPLPGSLLLLASATGLGGIMARRRKPAG